MNDLKATFESILKQLNGQVPITRFAPSPTGYLHLGHVVSMLYVWGIARALGGKIILRLEDHDRGRCRPEFEDALTKDLAWLGFRADEGWGIESRPARSQQSQAQNSEAQNSEAQNSQAQNIQAPNTHAHYIQSQSGKRYESAIRELQNRDLVYGCTCTRKQIAALDQSRYSSDTENAELFYPGTCRSAGHPTDDSCGWRIRMDNEVESFTDGFLGPLKQNPSTQCGDLLARDRTRQWTYQFAVVQDDIVNGVNLIVRGQDLTESTGRQIALRRRFTNSPPPVFAHHPLVLDDHGKKLSKRTLAVSIDSKRLAGVAPEAIITEAALLSGIIPGSKKSEFNADHVVTLDEVLSVFKDAAHRGGA